MNIRFPAVFLLLLAALVHIEIPAQAQPASGQGEVRGTWLTTTGDDAISTPAKTAATMRRLREIGINTVYVETWKNGYTQFPSQVLKKTLGVDRQPDLMRQESGKGTDKLKREPRDRLEETLIEAHRNGLISIAWFESGFVAAHKDTFNHLRGTKPEWLSRDIQGNEVAPNGCVWLNPLHPEARRFLLDIMLEAIDHYDLDGVQLDEGFAWPHVEMGYDDYTKKVYAQEHEGKEPPEDEKDVEWMRWRCEKINAYARQFANEIRAKRPGIIISLSPTAYPTCAEQSLVEWPKWAAWDAKLLDLNESLPRGMAGTHWDEFIPMNDPMSDTAFEQTWVEQNKAIDDLGGGRRKDMLAGIRIAGDGHDSTWEQLSRSIAFSRKMGNGGHVLWLGRGVLDVYPEELAELYGVSGTTRIKHPKFPREWRTPSIPLSPDSGTRPGTAGGWTVVNIPAGKYRIIERVKAAQDLQEMMWRYARDEKKEEKNVVSKGSGPIEISVGEGVYAVELLVDRREELSKACTGQAR